MSPSFPRSSEQEGPGSLGPLLVANDSTRGWFRGRGLSLFLFRIFPSSPLDASAKLRYYCRSYSPLLTRFSTVKPAFLASEIDTVLGELNWENTFRTGFLQAGHLVKGGAESGRRKVNLPPQTLQSPSQSSYSYNGMSVQFPGFSPQSSSRSFNPKSKVQSRKSRSTGARQVRDQEASI